MRKITSTLFVLLSVLSFGQHEELNQRLDAFIADHAEDYEYDDLNLSRREIGDIDETEHNFSKEFLLKSNERSESELGRNQYERIYINAYGYYNESERDFAVKFWLRNFIEGNSVRPGRDMRSYEYATPTVIIINEDHIVVLNYDCAWDSYEYFDKWREKMNSYFADANSVIIEIRCDGPLEWTKNPPDRSDRTWR